MRWPLRNKIVVRLILLLFGTIVVITIANLQVVNSANEKAFEDRIQQISTLVTTSRFPLTPNVLENMSQLSGAEFAVVDETGNRLSSSSNAPESHSLTVHSAAETGRIDLNSTIRWKDRSYIHVIMPVAGRSSGDSMDSKSLVHIFVDQSNYRELWRQSIRTPLWVAGIVTPVTFLIGLALASYVTRPLRDLQTRVRRIAAGELIDLKRSKGNDEITDLQDSLNEMIEKLKDHDEQLRHNERLKTLIQMGSGIAHNLKNCVTGCRMAVDLLASEDESVRESEGAQVALRQLSLMNTYIDRFITLGRSDDEHRQKTDETVNLADTLNSVIFLLGPTVKHLDVDLEWSANSGEITVEMRGDDAEQMMLNLINNAVEAASNRVISPAEERSTVQVELVRSNQGVKFTVTDNGAGPPDDVADSIMNPFVSGKKEGVGLGLALVNEIVKSAEGTLDWERVNDLTRFQVVLKVAENEQRKQV